ncbi:MAG TPA: PAS domain S-box protein [Blastocatellia bacterium]|nr:PAS domain S-box protein [Blastocatellia bacterium]
MNNLTEVRLLLIEDNPTDVLLLRRALHDISGMTFILTQVERLADGIEQLQQASFDLVLLDLGLPDSDGISTFTHLHQQFPTVPVLVFTGLDDETIGIRALQEGAQDYVIKYNLDGPLLKRALRYAVERQRIMTALQESQRNFQQLVESVPQQIWMCDAHGHNLYASPQLTAYTGLPVTETSGQIWMNQVHPEDQASLRQAWREATTSCTPLQIESRIRRHDGCYRWFDVRALPQRDATGHILKWFGTNTDIQEQREIREALRASEERVRLATEAAPIGFWERDFKTNQLTWSAREQQLMGYEPGTFPGTYEAFYALVHPADRQRLAETQEIARKQGIYKTELRCCLPDGRERWGLMYGQMIYDQAGQPKRLVGIDLDITERKRAETALRQSHEQLRLMIEQAPVAIAMFDRNMCYLAASRRWKTDFRKDEDLIGRSHYEVFPTLPEHWKQVHQRALAGEIHQRDEDPWIQPDGTLMWSCWAVQPWRDAYGEIGGIIISTEDITPKKQAAERLRAGEQRLQAVVENLAEGLIIVNTDGRISRWNRAAMEMYGFQGLSEATLQLSEFQKLFELSTLEGEVLPHEAWPSSRILQGEKLRGYEVRIRRIGTNWARVFSFGGQMIHEACGNRFAVLTVSDITERKQAEESLRFEKERLEKLAMASPSAMYSFRVTPDGKTSLLYSSPVNYELYGLTPAESGPVGERVLSRIHPEDREPMLQVMTNAWHAQSILNQTYRYHHPQHGEIWIEAFAAPTLEADGSVTWHGVANDVTARQLAEEKIRQSEAHFRALFESGGVGSVECDAESKRFLRVNQKMCEILGYSAEELLERTFIDITHPADREPMLEQYQSFIQGQATSYEVEKRYIRKDGSVVWVSVTSALLHDSLGNPWHTVAVVQDITKRKQAEVELEQSLEQIRSLALHLQDVREEECKRIARELHDELGQALAGLRFDLFWLENHLVAEPTALEACLSKTRSMADLINSTIEAGRKIATELRPRILDDLGLIVALKWQAQEFQTRTGIQCTFHSAVETLTINPACATALFRIFQETLTNVARHAQATAVQATLQIQDHSLWLTVRDNGRGITVQEMMAVGSLGLVGMRERVLPFGGAVRICGQANQGTTVTVQLPL